MADEHTEKMKMERNLASIKRITEIKPIEGADAIECAIVGGGSTDSFKAVSNAFLLGEKNA